VSVFSAIRIFECELPGGDVAAARVAARGCVDGYDQIVAAGRGQRLHRVAHLLYQVGCECRRQLLSFADGVGESLRSFPVAHQIVKRYALIPLVGRRVEGMHALIKKIGAVAKNISPPMISAALSEPVHQELLKSSPAFKVFCIKHWRSKTLLNELLQLVVPNDELDSLTRLGKLERIYQCGLSSEFRDLRSQRQAHDEFQRRTFHLRRGPPRDMPSSWRAFVSFVKAMMEPNVVFCLPSQLYNVALQPPNDETINMGATNPWDECIAFVGQDAVQFDIALASSHVFFEVTNAYPEKRKKVVSNHID
jgi:hypothetical protein